MPKRQRNPHDRSWMPRISGTRESYHTTQIEHNPARPKRNAPIPMCDARMVPKGTLRLAGWRWRVLNDHRAGHRPCFSMREVVATRNLTGSGDACLRRPACRCSVGWSKRSHSGGLGPPATSAFVNPVSRGGQEFRSGRCRIRRECDASLHSGSLSLRSGPSSGAFLCRARHCRTRRLDQCINTNIMLYCQKG